MVSKEFNCIQDTSSFARYFMSNPALGQLSAAALDALQLLLPVCVRFSYYFLIATSAPRLHPLVAPAVLCSQLKYEGRVSLV